MELWRYPISGGTPNIVKDINSGSGHGDPIFLTVVPTAEGDRLFFIANDGTNSFELWKSDGTESGTAMVKDINPNGNSFINVSNQNPSNPLAYWGGLEWQFNTKFLVIGNKIYFRAFTEANGMELWESDGTSEGTVMIKDIYQGPASTFPKYLTNVNGQVFFLAYNPDNGWEWWKYDPYQPINAPMDVETLTADNYKIDFYPNPANEYLIISGEFKNNVNLNIKIFDLLGNELLNIEKSSVSRISEQFNISTFPTGMYIINFRFNGQSVQQKFIKK
jgi:ELWxxDGT repeat protein